MTLTRIEPRPLRVPVMALTTANLTLSGTQTVDGVSCGPGSVVGALGQSDNKSAIYFVPLAGGAWIPVDPGVGRGLEVYALAGSTNGGAVYGCDTAGAITWGTTSTSFTKKSLGAAVFDPAAPGNIGATTQGSIQATELDAKTYASDTTLPSALAGFLKLFSVSVTGGNTDLLRLLGRTGDSMALEFPNGTGTSKSRILLRPVSLVNGGTTASVGTGGRGGVILVVGTTNTAAIGGLVLCSRNGTVNGTGCATSNFSTTDSASNLCALAGSNDVTIKNNSSGTVDLLIVALLHDAN